MGSLVDWLVRIAESDSIDELDEQFHRALRNPAAALATSERSLSPAEIAEIEASPELAALSGAVHLRSLEALEFWRPLLKHCMTGKSLAPVDDLQRIQKEASTLVSRLELRPPSPIRDEVLRLARDSEERVRRWLPSRDSRSTVPSAATRYSRGAFEKLDEDGNPIERPPMPEDEGPPPESAVRRVLGWGLTAAVVFALGWAVWMKASEEPKAPPLSHYQAFISEITERSIADGELGLTVGSSWTAKPKEVRGKELHRLLKSGEDSGRFRAIRVLDGAGTAIVTIEASSPPDWLTEADNPERKVERSKPLIEDGQLARPLRPDEIPID